MSISPSPSSMPEKGTVKAKLFVWIAFSALLTAQAGLLAYGAYVHSPVYDETAHLPAGLSWWLLGRTDVYTHNPPLVKCVAALPVLAVGAKQEWRALDAHCLTRPEFGLGQDFTRVNGERVFWLFTLARWACIPFATLGGVVIFLWSRAMYGAWAGLLSLILWSFLPDVLGNGHLCTMDIAAASFCIASAWTFRNWLLAPSRWNWSMAALTLGLAGLTKFTCLVLFPLWGAIWLAARISTPQNERKLGPASRSFAALFALWMAALLIINAGYRFRGSLLPLREHEFFSSALSGQTIPLGEINAGGNRFRKSQLGLLPIPLPRDYVCGIDLQKYDFERGFRGYLRGEWKHGGWWYYYIYGLSVKTPVGAILLFAASLIYPLVVFKDHSSRVEALCLALPSLTIVTIVSSQTGINLFIRYALPAIPFAIIGSSRVAAANNPWQAKLFAWICVAASTASSLWVYPHSLSYFNEMAGGPANAARHLLDGNVGWGQDLLYLKRWYDRHPEARPLGLVYFGNMDARIAGIDFHLPPRGPTSPNNPCTYSDELQGPKPGWFVIDISFVHGMNRRILDENGAWSTPPGACDFSYFQHFKPVDRIAYSMLVYHITLDEANRVRERLGLSALAPAESPIVNAEAAPANNSVAKYMGR